MNIAPFDSFDDMMEQMRRDQQEADSRVEPWQADVKAGDYFRKATDYGFSIYGEVLREREKRPPHLENYRFCKCYSVACVDGEMGDIHVSTIERVLSKAEFDTAKEKRWHA